MLAPQLFTVLIGFFDAFLTLTNQIFEPVGYDSDTAGFLGAAVIISGLIACVLPLSFSPLTPPQRPHLRPALRPILPLPPRSRLQAPRPTHVRPPPSDPCLADPEQRNLLLRPHLDRQARFPRRSLRPRHPDGYIILHHAPRRA